MTANGQSKKMPDSDTFQPPTHPVIVHDVTMLSALGDDVMQVAAAVRAGISRFNESVFYNQKLLPLKMALVPDGILPPLDDELLKKGGISPWQKRLLRLATRPLTTLFETRARGRALPLFLACPETLPGRRYSITDRFLSLLEIQTKQAIDMDNSYLFPFGRAAGLCALEAAMLHIEKHPGSQVIVGGVDSYIDPYLLSTLAQKNRIAGHGVMDGLIPGEGAAFLLIGAAPQLSAEASVDTGSRFILYPPGIASEPGHRYSSEPYRGEGLANAVTDALDVNLNSKVDTVMISFNGENFFAKEWGVAAIRNAAAFTAEPAFLHPADCFGDVGAAFGPMAIGVSIMGMHKKYLTSPALICCSSEMEQRSAVCLTVI